MGGEGPGARLSQPGMPVVQFRYKLKTFISTFNPGACTRGKGEGR